MEIAATVLLNRLNLDKPTIKDWRGNIPFTGGRFIARETPTKQEPRSREIGFPKIVVFYAAATQLWFLFFLLSIHLSPAGGFDKLWLMMVGIYGIRFMSQLNLDKLIKKINRVKNDIENVTVR